MRACLMPGGAGASREQERTHSGECSLATPAPPGMASIVETMNRLCFLFIVPALLWGLSVNGQTPLFRDADAAVGERVEDLLQRMTVDEKIDLLRATSPANERLGFPKYYHGNEALHGVVRPGRFTVFPQAIGLAATWDPELILRVSSHRVTSLR